MKRFLKNTRQAASKRRIAIIILAIVALSAVIWIVTHQKKIKQETAIVATVPVTQKNVSIYGEYVGRIRAQQFVEIRARVEGFLEEMLFE